MNKYDGFTNSQISRAIDECIHSQRDRDILKDRFIDGLTFEAIAEKYSVHLFLAPKGMYTMRMKQEFLFSVGSLLTAAIVLHGIK